MSEAFKPVRTTCPYCGVGCGIVASVANDGAVSVRGDPDHPANFGKLCSKGAALAETLSLDGRLRHPIIQGEKAGWDEALDLVAERFGRAIAKYGPDSVAFYISGQLLTEDYYVANKLMKGFIGSANIDTNSRLCMASSVSGHKRAFGSDTVPGCYEDLELADLVVLVGSNLAWCHPVLYQRLSAAREQRGTKIVVIDPRRTATCEIADLHLPLAPGSDVALFNGLLREVAAKNVIDDDYVEAHTTEITNALTAARPWNISNVARETGLDEPTVEDFYRLFVETRKVVTVYSQGVNQSTVGTDKVNAILNCHLATGRIGRPGTGPFSVTGQPNAMGGREVGGLANQLACHMELENAGHREIVQEFWGSTRIARNPGLKAVDLFEAVGDGRIKALWIMGTNPVDSLPDADAARAALDACPFVVVSDVERRTDTTAHAHVLLPSAAWGEKDGTVTNSERRISRQRRFLPGPEETKPDWWQFNQVARRMGFSEAFPYEHPADILAEYASLSALDSSGPRDFDISACADITRDAYEGLEPFQWPFKKGQAAADTRFFAEGGFFTQDRRARIVATPHHAPDVTPSGEFPLVLNTGRIRDQWHTMTRTGKAARLTQHFTEPFVEIHPEDSATTGVKNAQLAVIQSALGSITVRTLVSDSQRPGSVFVPIHWTDQQASSARVDRLVAARTDPVSGQPESKLTPVAVTPFEPAWHGFAVMGEQPRHIPTDYWAMAPAKAGWRVELACTTTPDDWSRLAKNLLLPDDAAAPDILAYHDATSGQHRIALFEDDRLLGALFVNTSPVEVSRSWVAEQLSVRLDDPAARLRTLAGHPGGNIVEKGEVVCACFEIGVDQIIEVASGTKATVDYIGKMLGAGTNCGSCRPEISRIIKGVITGTQPGP